MTRKLIQSLKIMIMKLMIKVRGLIVKYPACKTWTDISICEYQEHLLEIKASGVKGRQLFRFHVPIVCQSGRPILLES